MIRMALLAPAERVLFIHTWKCAGWAIESALRVVSPSVLSSPRTIRQRLRILASLGLSNVSLPDVRRAILTAMRIAAPLTFAKPPILHAKFAPMHSHMSNAEFRQILGDKRWQSFRRHVVARHPFDRAISLYFGHGGYESGLSVERWIAENPHFLKSWAYQVSATAPKRISNYSVNFLPEWDPGLEIIWWGELEQGLMRLAQSLNLEPRDVFAAFRRVPRNASGRPQELDAEEFLTPSARDLVWTLTQFEFENLGWSTTGISRAK